MHAHKNFRADIYVVANEKGGIIERRANRMNEGTDGNWS